MDFFFFFFLLNKLLTYSMFLHQLLHNKNINPTKVLLIWCYGFGCITESQSILIWKGTVRIKCNSLLLTWLYEIKPYDCKHHPDTLNSVRLGAMTTSLWRLFWWPTTCSVKNILLMYNLNFLLPN